MVANTLRVLIPDPLYLHIKAYSFLLMFVERGSPILIPGISPQILTQPIILLQLWQVFVSEAFRILI